MPWPKTLEEAREQIEALHEQLEKAREKASRYGHMVMQKNVEIVRLKGENLRLREALERRADEPVIVEGPG